MTAAPYTFEAAGQMLDYGFGTAASFQISILICKAHHRIRVADVNEFGVWSGRIKCDTERARKSGRESFGGLGFSTGGYASEHQDAARPALCQKQVAIGRCSKQSRIFQILGVELNFESVRGLWPRVRWTRHHLCIVVRRRRRVWLGQIGCGDVVNT